MEAARRVTNGSAIASLVLGIAGLVVVPLIAPLALVFGYRARREIAERGDEGRGLATAGIVLGWIGVALLVLGVLLVLLLVATLAAA